MSASSDAHLLRLADPASVTVLSQMGFDWSEVDRNACAAIRFRRRVSDRPALAAFLGGASSGKSTLFNTLLDAEVSRISAHAHETLGPVLAVHESRLPAVRAWLQDQLLLPPFRTVESGADEPTTGQVDSVALHAHASAALLNVLLADLPDVTSRMSADEGAISRSLLPWFDALVVVVDEERWFDAAVFEDTMEWSRNFGGRAWVVFNRTERAEPLTPEQEQRLVEHAAAHHAAGHCISPFRPGFGYRPASAATRDRMMTWLAGVHPRHRGGELAGYLQRRCAALSGENLRRSERFDRMCRAVDKELADIADDASLSMDLLTPQERDLLGLRHRFMPLYDALKELRSRVSLLRGKRPAAQGVDFEKRTDHLADVLRRNLDQRFRRAADRIDAIVANSAYLDETGGGEAWSSTWSVPAFDEVEWARRIRAHIDAWKSESSRQSQRGDVAALSVGVPLLLADMLFLGGAGITLGWAAAWVAGFFGGKGALGLLQRSPALNEYRTTVRAYQSFIREALSEQWEANRSGLPRRHMKMADPMLQALMHWSTPGAGG